MNAYQNGLLVLDASELENINGGVQWGGNGEIFNSGLEMVAEAKDMIKAGGVVSSGFGLVQATIGGWYLIIGGTLDWMGNRF